MTITAKPTHYYWITLTVESGNTAVTEDIYPPELKELKEQLEYALYCVEEQLKQE